MPERELDLEVVCRQCEAELRVTILANYDNEEIWGTWKCSECNTGNEWDAPVEKYFDESQYDTISEREGR